MKKPKTSINEISSNESSLAQEAGLTSAQNDFVIFDCFKNILNKNKRYNDKEIPLDQNVSGIHLLNESSIFSRQDNINCDEKIEELKDDFLSEKNKTKNSYQVLKKKLKYYKTNYEQCRLDLRKEKKITEMLNYKLFYESNRYSIVTNDKLNSTGESTVKVSNSEDNNKINTKLFDKLQENVNLFETLENEIMNKESIIMRQNDIIKQQKDTIDKLLDSFNVFSNQGNFLVNDILLLKQRIYDKNFNEVSKEFNEMNTTINDYSQKIKDLADQTKTLVNSQLNTIHEVSSDNSVSFNLTRSNRVSTFNEDVVPTDKKVDDMSISMRILDLGNSINTSSNRMDQDQSMTESKLLKSAKPDRCLISSSNADSFNIRNQCINTDKEIEELFDDDKK